MFVAGSDTCAYMHTTYCLCSSSGSCLDDAICTVHQQLEAVIHTACEWLMRELPSDRWYTGSQLHLICGTCIQRLAECCRHHLQECKALNARLIAFLREKETVKKLVSFVIEPPKSWASERQQQRFPFIACEVQSAHCTHGTLSFAMFARSLDVDFYAMYRLQCCVNVCLLWSLA